MVERYGEARHGLSRTAPQGPPPRGALRASLTAQAARQTCLHGLKGGFGHAMVGIPMTPADAKKISSGFTAWAREQSSVRAIAMVGSWAREKARPDSDLDLLVLTNDKGAWTSGSEWINAIAISLGFQADKAKLETYGVVKSWRVWLGKQVELELTLGDISWAGVDPIDNGTREVIKDGFRILIDKDNLLTDLRSAVGNTH
jgi:predicted nucleotidyltransferase